VVGKEARRIISSWWHRFKHTVENKPVTVVVLAAESCVRSCAALSLELTGQSEWVSTNEVKLPAAEICNWDRRKPTRLANTRQIRIVATTHGNLLLVNSIAVRRHRPIIPAAKEVQFKALAG